MRGYVLEKIGRRKSGSRHPRRHGRRIYVDPAIVGRVFDGKRAHAKPSANKSAAPALTDREAAVLKMAALGFTNKEIASRLDVGVKSVETYKARGLEKLGLKHARRIGALRLGPGLARSLAARRPNSFCGKVSVKTSGNF